MGDCIIKGCAYKHRVKQFSNGYCMTHYQQIRRTGKVTKNSIKKFTSCAIKDCPYQGYQLVGGLCINHYRRKKRYGDPTIGSYKGVTHGETVGYNQSVEYSTYMSMKQRCLNPNDRFYAYYGGRGIIICERWLDNFKNFLEDMGRRPSGEYSIDRIDVDGNYEPSNCRWATNKEQVFNRRNLGTYGRKIGTKDTKPRKPRSDKGKSRKSYRPRHS